MAGVHAQVLSAAETSLAIRVEGATRADVRTALWQERSLVKTFGPRGTVHLLPTADLPYWTAALRSIPWHSPHAQDVRMDEGQTDLVVAAIDDALADSELTVDELTEAIVQRVGPWAGERVMPAFQDQWPRWRQATAWRHTAACCASGPTAADASRTPTPAAGWPPSSRSVPTRAPDGSPASGSPHTAPAAPRSWAAGWEHRPRGRRRPSTARTAARFRRLPTDRPPRCCCRTSTHTWWASGPDRCSSPAGPGTGRLTPSGQAGNYPVLLVDGVVEGVWHSRRVGSTVHVTVETLRELTARRVEAVEERVLRLGRGARRAAHPDLRLRHRGCARLSTGACTPGEPRIGQRARATRPSSQTGSVAS